MPIKVGRSHAVSRVKDLAESFELPVCVGIDGRGGAGKSGFASELAASVPSARVVSLDDFVFLDRIMDDSWEAVWDRSRLRREVLIPFRERRCFEYRPVNWETGELGPLRVFEGVDFLVVEGITALHPDLRDHYDLSVWIDTPADLAQARGLARDQGAFDAQVWARWRDNDDNYETTWSAAACADVLVDNRHSLSTSA